MKKTIKIIIADDSKLTLMGLKTTFSQEEDIEVLATVENGKEAVEKTLELTPDIILMDIGMPIMDGIQATKNIKANKSNTKVIMLTSHNSDKDVLDAFSAGATSYCMKEIEPKQLVNVLKETYNGLSWIDPMIARIVLNNLDKAKQKKNTDLTEREIEILSLIAKGYSNQKISEELYISMNTVKTHIKNIFSKLEVEDRTQAAMKAVEKNII